MVLVSVAATLWRMVQAPLPFLPLSWGSWLQPSQC